MNKDRFELAKEKSVDHISSLVKDIHATIKNFKLFKGAASYSLAEDAADVLKNKIVGLYNIILKCTPIHQTGACIFCHYYDGYEKNCKACPVKEKCLMLSGHETNPKSVYGIMIYCEMLCAMVNDDITPDIEEFSWEEYGQTIDDIIKRMDTGYDALRKLRDRMYKCRNFVEFIDRKREFILTCLDMIAPYRTVISRARLNGYITIVNTIYRWEE
jgi:hypothetical protein